MPCFNTWPYLNFFHNIIEVALRFQFSLSYFPQRYFLVLFFSSVSLGCVLPDSLQEPVAWCHHVDGQSQRLGQLLSYPYLSLGKGVEIGTSFKSAISQ